MATNAITVDELRANLLLVLGINRDYDQLDATTQADIDRVWRAGRRKYLAAHDWQHLQSRYVFVTTLPYTTGTVTVVDGVVTLSGGTFPADTDRYVFIPETGGVYEVASRDGDTQITLQDTSLDVDAGSTFSLYQIKFPLPSGYAGTVTPFTIENSQSDELTELPLLPEFTVRSIGGRNAPVYGRPEAWTTFQTVDSETGVFTPFLQVYPIPDQVYTVTARVRIEPGDSLAEAGTICHPMFSELLQEAILAAGEQLYLAGTQRTHTDNFATWLPRFIERDNRLRGVKHLPPRKSRKFRRDPLHDLRTATVTWEE